MLVCIRLRIEIGICPRSDTWLHPNVSSSKIESENPWSYRLSPVAVAPNKQNRWHFEITPSMHDSHHMSVASLVHSGETHIVGSYWSRVMGVKHRGQTVALFSIGHPHSIETYLGVGDMVCVQWPAILRIRSTKLPKRNTMT